MTELACVQISDVVSAPAAPITTLFDQERKHHSVFIKQLKVHADISRYFLTSILPRDGMAFFVKGIA